MQQGEPFHHDGGSGLGGQSLPGRPGAVGGGDGRFGLRGAQVGHLRQPLPGGGVAHGKVFGGVHPLPVDQGLGLEQRRVFQGSQWGGQGGHGVFSEGVHGQE